MADLKQRTNKLKKYLELKEKELQIEKKRSFWKGAFVGWGIFMTMYIIYKII